MSGGPIPLIDVARARGGDAATRLAVGREIDAACRDIGFFCIAGHGIDPALVAAMRRVSAAFFDLPLAEKLALKAGSAPGSPGYIAVGQHALSYTRDEAKPPDLNEIFTVGPVDVPAEPYFSAAEGRRWFVENRWPDLVGFRQTWTAYYRAARECGLEVLRLAGLGLGAPEGYFDARLDRQISRLTVREYPAQPAAPLPGQLRAAAHTDFGALTLLLPEDKPGGLQVRLKDASWADVTPPPGAYVVNIGDMLSQWTNGVWVSTLHRVVNPPREQAAEARRQSLVFFQIPNYDTVIECIPACAGPDNPPRHAPIRSGTYYLDKVARMRAGAARG